DGVTARVGENEWYMTTTSGGASRVYSWIQWWLQSGWGDGVHLTQATDGWAAFNLAGPDSRNVLADLLDESQDAEQISSASFPYMHVRELALASIPCRLMRIGFTGELSYEIHCPAGCGMALWEAILKAGEAYGIQPFGVEAQRTLRLEKGHIIVGQDTDALTNPLMADMEWLVKLDKEDFLGQRMLKREAENGVTEKLVGFKMISQEFLPEEGLQIVKRVKRSDAYPLGLKILGWVTSARRSPTLNEIIGLCWLPKEMADSPITTFKIRRAGQLLEAKVHHGPFYDADGGRLKG
ncbi:MAG: aminomethyltransferase family protein, partial [Chloroflexota bacterium]